jgi:hypothetical protein
MAHDMKFSVVNDPTTWYVADPELVLTFANADEAKRAEAIFNRLASENYMLREYLGSILLYSAGWDESGSTGPKEPYSWETVGRVALDLARAALGGK